MRDKAGDNQLFKKLVLLVLKLYARVYHRMETRYSPLAPARPPFLALTSHFSMLDVPALMVADRYQPGTAFVVKDSMLRVPVVGRVIRAWGGVPVARDGQDLRALRDILVLLHSGRGVCVAAEGARSRTGRLGPLHPVLTRLALRVASEGIPVFPLAEVGTFEALPAGAVFPRPRKIRVLLGDTLDLGPWLGKHVGDAELTAAAALIQAKIADLLPPERRPAPGTPALGPVRSEPNKSPAP